MITAISTCDHQTLERLHRRPAVAAATPKRCDTKRRFDRLVAPLRVDLLRFATWMSRNSELAQEIVQETMLRAWRGLDSLQDEAAIKQWLFSIARREHARLYDRKQLPVKNLDYLTPDEQLQSAICEDDALFDIRHEILCLRKNYREPLVLQVLLGFSMKEIAGILDITVSAVGVRLHRARLEIAKNMREDNANVG